MEARWHNHNKEALEGLADVILDYLELFKLQAL